WPVGMFAPSEFVATGPRTPRAAAVSRVVVVLPLVPETSAIFRPAARWESRSGSILRPIHPPITDPSPRPAARESAAAVFATVVAMRARNGTELSVIAVIRHRPPVRGAASLRRPTRRQYRLPANRPRWRPRWSGSHAHDRAGGNETGRLPSRPVRRRRSWYER